MALFADDDVVVHSDAKRLGDFDDGVRHLDVGAPLRQTSDRRSDRSGG